MKPRNFYSIDVQFGMRIDRNVAEIPRIMKSAVAILLPNLTACTVDIFRDFITRNLIRHWNRSLVFVNITMFVQVQNPSWAMSHSTGSFHISFVQSYSNFLFDWPKNFQAITWLQGHHSPVICWWRFTDINLCCAYKWVLNLFVSLESLCCLTTHRKCLCGYGRASMIKNGW